MTLYKCVKTKEEQLLHLERLKLNRLIYLERNYDKIMAKNKERGAQLYVCPCCKYEMNYSSKSRHNQSINHIQQHKLLKQYEDELYTTCWRSRALQGRFEP